MGSHLVGDRGWPAAALVYLGYPLVPMGKRNPRDTDHLERIEVPQLFVAGRRDRLSPPALVEPLAARLPVADVLVVAYGGHSLEVTKRSGRDADAVLRGVAGMVAGWVAQAARAPSGG